MFPKLMLVGLIVIWGCGVVAFPARVTVTGVLEAVLVIVTAPVTLPATVGAKVTDREAVCPPARVAGSDSPLAEKPDPEAAICEIV